MADDSANEPAVRLRPVCDGAGLQLSYNYNRGLSMKVPAMPLPASRALSAWTADGPFLSFRFLKAFALFQAFERRDLA